MDPKTEIRRLSPGNLFQLVQILEYNESWKRLMAIIPKTLTLDNFNCKIGVNNFPKYNTDHFMLIENAARQQKKPCSEILFEEWGTSGKIRPRIGHLLHLLQKAELYRAADYVAVQLLHVSPPERPETGPAAKVNITFNNSSTINRNLENFLDNINYSSSALNYSNPYNVNINSNFEQVKQIPKIVVNDEFQHEIPSSIFTNSNNCSMGIPFLPQNGENNYKSDQIPALTSLLNASDSINQSIQINNSISFNLSNSNEIDNYNFQLSGNIPAFSQILETENTPVENSGSITTEDFPQISFLLENSSNLSPNFQQSDESELQISRKNSLTPNPSTNTACASPLPNLSLNTVLPHFTYSELEQSTENFNETTLRFDGGEAKGRKLGSGAFGSVYLGLNLLDKPVAVKKLNINETTVVYIDDTITKQFKNEVELLCKYKHENLLSLLGYSCDGPTYCLVYEYISGGALKDRLQSTENRLIWTNRLYIALGTAKAVWYLHNAYSTPLIHRDIKSANILLDNADKPKLCDFGLIKLTPNQNTNTSTTVFGTSAYMAPEAFRGDVSVKLDTFSFGVVLLELLTGLPPLDENRDGNDLVTHIEDVCDDNIRPLLDTKAGLWTLQNIHFGDELYEIARQCLEEKKKRPFMTEVLKQLSELIDKTTSTTA